MRPLLALVLLVLVTFLLLPDTLQKGSEVETPSPGDAAVHSPAPRGSDASPPGGEVGQEPGGRQALPVEEVRSFPSPPSISPSPEPTSSPGAAPQPDMGLPGILEEMSRLLDAPRWPRAQWGVLAVSLDRGDTLFARDAHTPFVPASNMKILTTAAALHHLGPDFRFPTFLLADGRVEGGVLHGDLILYGTGDPALSDRFAPSSTDAFEQMVRDLKVQGIHTITGNIIGDGTFFSGPLLGPEWNVRDLNDWFAAPVSALSYNENVMTMQIAPAPVAGAPPVIRIVPREAGVSVVNRATTVTGSSRRPLWASRIDPLEPIVIEGEMGLLARESWRVMTVPEPPLYASAALVSVLEAEGLTVGGGAMAVHTPLESRVGGTSFWAPALGGGSSPQVMVTHFSPPLIELLEVVNRASHNLYAEVILMMLGRLVLGEGSFEGGAEVVRLFLEEEVGVAPGSVHVRDGSGLSHQNRISAGTFIRVMEYLSVGELWEPFLSTLPVAGARRPGLGRMQSSAAAGNLRAKTGTIDRVSALSGIVETQDGERILFSILANDVPSTAMAKRIEDRIGIGLAEFRRPIEVDRPFEPDRPAEPPLEGGLD